jgi:hypothetical protein
MTNAPAGWYDDGSGRQRWWNGQQWVQYADAAQPPAPYPAPAAAQAPLSAPPVDTATARSPHGPPLQPKEVGIAYALMLFTLVGVAGIQHFYLGKVGRGVLWLLTFGLLGIGTIIDLFTLPSQTKTINARRAVGIG